MSIIFSLFNRKSTLSKINKLLLYKQVIFPTILYACPVWSNTSLSNINRLQRVQTHCLRIILNKPRYTRIKTMHDILNYPYIEETIKDNTRKFFNTCSRSTDVNINQVGNYDYQSLRHRYKKYKHRRIKHILL